MGYGIYRYVRFLRFIRAFMAILTTYNTVPTLQSFRVIKLPQCITSRYISLAPVYRIHFVLVDLHDIIGGSHN